MTILELKTKLDLGFLKVGDLVSIENEDAPEAFKRLQVKTLEPLTFRPLEPEEWDRKLSEQRALVMPAYPLC